MTPELQRIVADSYGIFARHVIDCDLAVCHCACCMTPETMRELVSTPLREISAALLAEYTNSAHGWDDDRVAREMRFFLPRYLELIASYEPPDHIGLDICLRRMGRGGWRGKWPGDEEAVVDAFFEAFLLASLQRLDLAHWPVGWRLGFDLGEVLTLIVTGGGRLDHCLAAWDDAGDPAAVLHMAALRADVFPVRDRMSFASPFLEDHPDAAEAIGAFLMRPEVDRRIEAAFFAVDDPRLQELLSSALQGAPLRD